MKKMKLFGCSFRKRYVLAALLAMLLLLTGCQQGGETPLTAPPETEATEPVVQIETAYVALSFPEALVESMRHVEVTEGHITMEVFYMLGQTREWEVYRIIFGDAQVGNLVGYLSTASGEIPVTVMLSEYEDVFTEENERILFGQMSDAFSTLLNSICEDPRFSEMKYVAPVQDTQVKLRYWTLTVPENVQYAESGQGEGYRAEFFGIVNGTRIPLYTVLLGKAENPEDVLGSFTVDGKALELSIVVYDTGAYESWSQEDQSVIYNMMESINEVVFQLMEDENFSAGE